MSLPPGTGISLPLPQLLQHSVQFRSVATNGGGDVALYVKLLQRLMAIELRLSKSDAISVLSNP
ncbi:hypothetical protein SAM23877_3036 [Streptomyces ambofaciens ATCC 23877]|uniref:Uncharacterized protein n=1 Tax=Streptomyces ambofaciens (strain ATCC 23877 / 3486 / DSM 40053 / JCM 4204 / NBRC 12836 / NRRL B-2516) TaxID=278992 RepID=A0A0K2ASJ8_STRA7|nr:hypothetical protein SAM23877_3036 [Streptomyces ambofaciens ATCC 23877]